MNALIFLAIYIFVSVYSQTNFKGRKRSKSDIRFFLAFPFGLIAEFFATCCILISGHQCDVNFNTIGDWAFKDEC